MSYPYHDATSYAGADPNQAYNLAAYSGYPNYCIPAPQQAVHHQQHHHHYQQQHVAQVPTATSTRHHHHYHQQPVHTQHYESTAEQIAADTLELNRAQSHQYSSHSGAHHSHRHNSGETSATTAAVNSVISGAQTSYESNASYQQSQQYQSSQSQHQQTQSYSGNASASTTVLSQVEQAILRSNVPIDINETEEITVNGQRGIWANKQEVVSWRGPVPISQYTINEDSNPEIITKRSSQQVEYIQELAIRYLRPPTPPPPGEIIITQEVNSLTPPAPPLIIRQQPPRPTTPEPLVIREAPPQPPCQVGRKVITISGKRLPPPPRKVIIERLAPLPSKPQSVIVERWLPYSQVKRRVIFQRSNDRDPVIMKPRNVVIQWEAPRVNIKKEIKYLGVIRANPVEYVQRYSTSLKTSRELPDFVLDIKTPEGIVLAADYKYNTVHELEGEVAALKLVDLDREGLSEYRSYLQRLGISYVGASNVMKVASELTTSQVNISAQQSYSVESTVNASAGSGYNNSAGGGVRSSTVGYEAGSGGNFAAYCGSGSYENTGYGAAPTTSHQTTTHQYSSTNVTVNARDVIAEIFSSVDRDRNGRVSYEEAERLLLRLNSRLNRNYGENDVRAFFRDLDVNRDGSIDLREFRAAFERLI